MTAGLLIGGGLIYTVSAVGFNCQWPALRPATFSYHEVRHACTLTAAGLHLAAVWTIVAEERRRPGPGVPVDGSCRA